MTADPAATTAKHPLRAGSLPEILSDVHVEGQTGLLRFERKGARCEVRFVRGHIVYAATTTRELRLGEVLVAEGLLRPEHLEEATRLVLEQGHRLGEALQQLGLVDTELLEDFLSIHVREILVNVLTWTEGAWGFEEQDPEAHQVLEVTPLPRDQVEASLVGLIATGMIEVAPPEPTPAELETQTRRQEILDLHASLGGRGNRELLGVTAQATGAEIKAAYFRLAKRPGRPPRAGARRPSGPPRADLRAADGRVSGLER